METSRLRYLGWPDLFLADEKPYEMMIDQPGIPEEKLANVTFYDDQLETICDIRTSNTFFDLDTHGLTFVEHATQLNEDDFMNKLAIESSYLPECIKLLKANMDGADRIYIYNWFVYDSDVDTRENRAIELRNPISQLGPSRVVHTDQIPMPTVDRTLRELPLEAQELLQGRSRMVKYKSNDR